MKRIISVILAAVMLLSVMTASAWAVAETLPVPVETAPEAAEPVPEANPVSEPEEGPEDLLTPAAIDSGLSTLADAEAGGDADTSDEPEAPPPPLYTELPDGFYADDPYVLTNVSTYDSDWGPRAELQFPVETYGIKPDDFILITIEDDEVDTISVGFQSWYGDWNGWGGNWYGPGLGTYGNYVNQLFVEGCTAENIAGVQIVVNSVEPIVIDKITLTVARKEEYVPPEGPSYSIPEGYEVIYSVTEDDYEIVQQTDSETGEPIFNQDGTPAIQDYFSVETWQLPDEHFRSDDYILIEVDRATAFSHNLGIMSYSNTWEGWMGPWTDVGSTTLGAYVSDLLCGGVSSKNILGVNACIGNTHLGDVIPHVSFKVARNVSEPEPEGDIFSFMLKPGDPITDWSTLSGYGQPNWDSIKQYLAMPEAVLEIAYTNDDLTLKYQYRQRQDGSDEPAYASVDFPVSEYATVTARDDGVKVAKYKLPEIFYAYMEMASQPYDDNYAIASTCNIILVGTGEGTFEGASIYLERSNKIPEGYYIVDEYTLTDLVTEKNQWGEGEDEFTYSVSIPEVNAAGFNLDPNTYILLSVKYDKPEDLVLSLQSYDNNWGGWGGLYYEGPALGAYVEELFVNGVNQFNIKAITLGVAAPEAGIKIDEVTIQVAMPWEWDPGEKTDTPPEGYDVVYEQTGKADAADVDGYFFGCEIDIPGPFEEDDFILVSVTNATRFYDLGLQPHTDDWSKSHYNYDDPKSYAYGRYVSDLIALDPENDPGYTDPMTIDEVSAIFARIGFYGEGGSADYTIQVLKPHNDDRYVVPDGCEAVVLSSAGKDGDGNPYPPIGMLPAKIDGVDFDFGITSEQHTMNSQEFLSKVKYLSVSFEIETAVDANGKELEIEDLDQKLGFCSLVKGPWLYNENYDGLSYNDGVYKVEFIDLAGRVAERFSQLLLCVRSGVDDNGEFYFPAGTKIILKNVKWEPVYAENIDGIPEGFDVTAVYSGVIHPNLYPAEGEYNPEHYSASLDFNGPFDRDAYVLIEFDNLDDAVYSAFRFHAIDWVSNTFMYATPSGANSIGFYVEDMFREPSVVDRALERLNLLVDFKNELGFDAQVGYKITVARPHLDGRYEIPEGATAVKLNAWNPGDIPEGNIPVEFDFSRLPVQWSSDYEIYFDTAQIAENVEAISVTFNVLAVLDSNGVEIEDGADKLIYGSSGVFSRQDQWYGNTDYGVRDYTDSPAVTVRFQNLKKAYEALSGIDNLCISMRSKTDDPNGDWWQGNPLLPTDSTVIISDVEWDITYAGEEEFVIPEGYALVDTVEHEKISTEITEFGSIETIVLDNNIDNNVIINPDDYVYVEIEDDDFSKGSIFIRSFNSEYTGWEGFHGDDGATVCGAYVKDLFVNGVTEDNLQGIQVVIFSNDEPIELDKVTIKIYSKSDVMMGDVNGDGKVSLEDAISTLKFAMNVPVDSDVFNEKAADINGDDHISLEDAIAILKIAMNVSA